MDVGEFVEYGYSYGQDEDPGQLGAWHVMSAMKLFDVKGGVILLRLINEPGDHPDSGKKFTSTR